MGVCLCGFCNVWVCVCVNFVMCGCVSVCVNFVKFGCVYVLVFLRVGVLVIYVLVFTLFCIVCTLFFIVFF